jgi:glycosyltransferase involved in cell wall biosynthesis
MARGKPVLASDVGGHRELVTDGRTGLLFAAGKREALSGALVRLLRDADLRAALQRQGREFVERERTWARSVDGYREAYAGAMRRAQARGRDRA